MHLFALNYAFNYSSSRYIFSTDGDDRQQSRVRIFVAQTQHTQLEAAY